MVPLPSPDSPEERFTTLLGTGHQEAAAALLHDEYGAELKAGLAKLALSLGGADEAEHLANWAICQAVLKGGAYDPARGRLAPWLMRMARNLAISQLRKTRPLPGSRRPLAGSDGDAAQRTRSHAGDLESSEAVEAVLERLPLGLRRVLLVDLAHHGQAPAKLACGELGLERNVFYIRRSNARRLFRELWIELHGEPGESL